MTEQPLISIVMSTYREVADAPEKNGHGSSLGLAIDSVRRQSYGRWQLHIVADHPPAEDLEQAQGLIESLDDERIHFTNLAAWGGLDFPGYDAKIAGVEAAEGELLAFLDADNEWKPRVLERAVKAFAGDEALDLVYSDTLFRLHQREDLLPLRIFPLYQMFGPAVGESFVWRKPDWDSRARRQIDRLNFIDTSDAVLRRESYDACGGLQRKDNLDWNLWRAMIDASRDHFLRIPHVGTLYRTASLEQHRELMAVQWAEFLDLPFDLEDHRTRTKKDFIAHHREKHLADSQP